MSRIKLTLESGGADLDVQDNGTSVVNPASALNFTGAAKVTDAGGGKAEIEILEYWSESQTGSRSEFTAKGTGTNRSAVIFPKGAGGVGMGRSVQPTGAQSVSIGDQSQSTALAAIAITSEGLASGSQSLAIGRKSRATQIGASAYDWECQSEALRGTSRGFGGLQKNTGFDGFANSRGQADGNAAVEGFTGKNQIQNGIIGWDSVLTGTGNPDTLLVSADYIDLNNTFSGSAKNTPVAHFQTSGADRLVHFISYVSFYVNALTGSLGTIAAGDKKIVRIEQCGIISSGTLTLLGSVSSTVLFEDASLSGLTVAYQVVSNQLATRVTLPSLLGGGSINVRAAANCNYFETNIA